MFKDSDYEWLLVIDCLKNTGMGIKDIKRFIEMVIAGDSTIKERLQMIIRQRESVKEQMEKLQQTLDTLDYKVWYYSTAEKAGTTAVPRNMPEEEVPENLRAARRRLKLTHAHESDNPCQGRRFKLKGKQKSRNAFAFLLLIFMYRQIPVRLLSLYGIIFNEVLYPF